METNRTRTLQYYSSARTFSNLFRLQYDETAMITVITVTLTITRMNIMEWVQTQQRHPDTMNPHQECKYRRKCSADKL